ncbi:MAG: TPMT family class I SAM-dependent methyltransferase [Cytophagaceae bacterium]|nr:TPMT family class I SAM-dependent methyltransferase [Cytophagaceae bacterium]MDW8455760.1 methyltransferase domain-containing protein [Cytophagaceae bacterium]
MPDILFDLSKEYWENRYINMDIGWDTGAVTPPIKTYIDGLSDKNIRMLIPGCGNGYEAEYAFRKGFTNVHVLDIAITPLLNFKKRVADFPESQLLHKDFFTLTGSYDLIIEQTFFCALDPKLRKSYAQKMYELLAPEGVLAGLLFDDPLNTDRPPFGGSKEEYLMYFEPLFKVCIFESCYNSIPQRAGRELFIKLKKK